MNGIIELHDVGVTLGTYQALQNVNLSFAEGLSTVIMGQSGSGKSTLLKVAAGLIPADRGRVFFAGQDMVHMSEHGMLQMRRMNGFVFQDGALWENKTLFENLALPLQVSRPGIGAQELRHHVVRALERVGLEDSLNERPAALSGGEKKLASFLRALIAEPTLVFLDEPTLSIDHTMAERINQMIRDCKARGATIIAVTHDPRLTSTLADRLVVVDGGRVLETGAFDEVKTSRNVRVRSILSQVLGEIASYDTDLLQLLGDGPEDGAQ